MPSLRQKTRLPASARVALAGLLAITVVVLGLLEFAPAAHHWLHGHDASHAVAHDDAGCAVTLFAHGTTTPLELPHVIAPRPVFIATFAAEPLSLLLTATHHLTPPGRGPPALG
jgi:hypothetical protein